MYSSVKTFGFVNISRMFNVIIGVFLRKIFAFYFFSMCNTVIYIVMLNNKRFLSIGYSEAVLFKKCLETSPFF
jgi:uncharacterized membrane protein YgaE (UPF0421/DUF939 family)